MINIFPGSGIEIQDVHPMRRTAPFQNMVWLFDYKNFIPSSSSKDLCMLNKTLPKKVIQTENKSTTPPYIKILRDFNETNDNRINWLIWLRLRNCDRP
jgi:hypothetical protein